MKPRDRANYILILPSLFTTGNLFCGFYSMIQSFNHNYEKAAYAIILAGAFDLLDGRVARMTKSTSQFGLEYDSIADVVSFGVAPAILGYVWLLQDFGNLGWAASFFFAACGALRLARFNALAQSTAKSYFVGLPIPAAANTVAAAAILYKINPFFFPSQLMLVMMFVLGLLMVSRIRYRSFKDFDLRHRRKFFLLVLLVMVITIGATNPELTVNLLLLSYILWSPIREVFSWLKRKGAPRKESVVEERHDI